MLSRTRILFFDISNFFKNRSKSESTSKNGIFMIFGKHWDANKPTSVTIQTQKLPYADVWKCKMCLRRRMDLPFALVDRYDPKQVCKSIAWCMKAHRKVFDGTQVQAWRSPKHNFWSYFRSIRDFPSKMIIETQTLPCADVWKCKMCLRRHMGISFTLGDRYDPKQVFQSISWCIKAYRKIFHGTQV